MSSPANMVEVLGVLCVRVCKWHVYDVRLGIATRPSIEMDVYTCDEDQA